MGQIRVVLLFNEDNERQKEVGEYLKSQKRCKTALITELVYAWLHKESGTVASYNNESINIEEVKRQLLRDNDFLQQIKDHISVECSTRVRTEQGDGLDMDEGMLLAGMSVFENDF